MEKTELAELAEELEQLEEEVGAEVLEATVTQWCG
jgi:hypothetical protein